MELAAEAVQHGVAMRHPHRPGIDIRRRHLPVQQHRGRHGEHARAGAEIENAAGLAMRHRLQGPQAAAGRAMLAGAEGDAGIERDHLAARRGRSGEMGAADDKAAADVLFGKTVIGAREPALRLGGAAGNHRFHAGDQPGQRQRAGQRRLIGALVAHAFDGPEAGILIEEKAHRAAGRAQGGLIGLHGIGRHHDGDGLKGNGVSSGGHARSTKRSSTRFCPAFSKSMSSLSSSVAVTRP